MSLKSELEKILGEFDDYGQYLTAQAILDLLDKSLKEARIDELESLTKHRDFVYWGDGAASDLDKYLADRIKDVL